MSVLIDTTPLADGFRMPGEFEAQTQTWLLWPQRTDLPGVVALAWTDDQNDWRHEILAEDLEILEAASDAQGRRLEVHKVPLPADIVVTLEESAGIDMVEGSLALPPGFRQAATYINCVLCNGGLILPTFGDPNDVAAVEVMRGLFPGRTVVPLPSHEIILAGGNVHCISQQQPAGRSSGFASDEEEA